MKSRGPRAITWKDTVLLWGWPEPPRRIRIHSDGSAPPFCLQPGAWQHPAGWAKASSPSAVLLAFGSPCIPFLGPRWCWNVASHFCFFPENFCQARTRLDSENGIPEREGYIKSHHRQLLLSPLLRKPFSQGSLSNSEHRSHTCREPEMPQNRIVEAERLHLSLVLFAKDVWGLHFSSTPRTASLKMFLFPWNRI